MNAYIDIIIETLLLLPTVDLVKFALASEFFKNIFTENIRSFQIDVYCFRDDQLIFFRNAKNIIFAKSKIIDMGISKKLDTNIMYFVESTINGHGLIYLKRSNIINLYSCRIKFHKNLKFFVNTPNVYLNKIAYPTLRFVKNSHFLKCEYICNTSPSLYGFPFLGYLKKTHNFICFNWYDEVYSYLKSKIVYYLKFFHTLDIRVGLLMHDPISEISIKYLNVSSLVISDDIPNGELNYANNIINISMTSSRINDNVFFNFVNVKKIAFICDNVTNQSLKFLKNIVDLNLMTTFGNSTTNHYDIDCLTSLMVLRLTHYDSIKYLKINKLFNLKKIVLINCQTQIHELKLISMDRDIHIVNCNKYTNNMICEMNYVKKIIISGCLKITKDVRRNCRDKNIDVQFCYDDYNFTNDIDIPNV